jgi:hypothetical protein
MSINDYIDPDRALFHEIDDKFVCVDCLYDEGLKLFVMDRQPPSYEPCSYCGGTEKSVPVSSVQDHILHYFPCAPVQTFSPRNDGEWLIPGKPSDVWLERLLLHKIADGLYEDFWNNLIDDDYDEPDWSSQPLTDQWKGQWEEFREAIRHFGNYFGFDDDVILKERNHDEPHPLFFYNAIATALLRADAISLLPTRTRIQRVQWDHVDRTFGRLTCPPQEFAGANRFSPKGVSMFYGASDLITACLEIKAVPGDKVTLGTFETRRDLALIDFTAAKFPRGTFDPSWMGNYHISDFLRGFLEDIRRDVKGEGNQEEYLPTQALCDFFAKEGAAELLSVNANDPQPSPVLELMDKTKRLDGIRFHSSKVNGENSDCFVLFCDHEESADILELVEHDHLVFK